MNPLGWVLQQSPTFWLIAFMWAVAIYILITQTRPYKRFIYWLERKTGTEMGLNRLPREEREREKELRGGKD